MNLLVPQLCFFLGYATAVNLDASVLGRIFDGAGALSGGGATSRLLPNYAEPYRSDILDLLFKPNFGGSLHILKVETGGDTFSGCGTEPSHQHNASDLNFERGYEWWLMQEAKARASNIKGYALPWGMPNWVGASDGGSPLNAQLASYMTAFCQGAEGSGGGWQCDYIGVWNERSFSDDYVLQLRSTLDAVGLNSTKIVVADGGLSGVVDAIQANATFASAVDVIGVHYPGGSNSSEAALATGKTLWASEDSSTYFDASGGACLARILNWNYLYGSYTALIVWNLISSYLDHLFWYGDSLMGASTPWSGNYVITSPLWSMAHTTQFAQPGWYYLPSAVSLNGTSAGGAGELPGGGTYVTLIEPSSSSSSSSGSSYEWSLILETTTTAHSQCIRSNPGKAWSVVNEQNVTFYLGSNLTIPPSVIVWKSVFYTSEYEPSIIWFERQPDVLVNQSDNSFTLIGIHPDSVYSVTSLDRGQSHGVPSSPIPPPAPFPLPYSDDFGGYTQPETMPAYFSDQTGSFSLMPRRDVTGELPLVYEQVVVALPVAWGGDSAYPLTIIGDWNMTDVDVTIDAFIYSNAVIDPTPSGGDPLLYLLPCSTQGDLSQIYYFNASTSVALPGSLVDARLGQCVDVDGCNPSPQTPLWMWPCVTSAPGTNCLSQNQLWTYSKATGHITSQMTGGLCLTATAEPPNQTTAYAIIMEPCTPSPPPGSYQSFSYDAQSGQLSAVGSGGLCLSNQGPPPPGGSDQTHVGIGLRLGGLTASSSVAAAYADSWYNYGYFFSVRPDGSWAIYAGESSPSSPPASPETRKRGGGGRGRNTGTPSLTASGGSSSLSSSSSFSSSSSRKVLAQGALPPGEMGIQQWHKLRFSVAGDTLTAYFDGAQLAQIVDTTYPVGWAGLSTGWHIAQFANFSMQLAA